MQRNQGELDVPPVFQLREGLKTGRLHVADEDATRTLCGVDVIATEFVDEIYGWQLVGDACARCTKAFLQLEAQFEKAREES
jgi:hypothetical protein